MLLVFMMRVVETRGAWLGWRYGFSSIDVRSSASTVSEVCVLDRSRFCGSLCGAVCLCSSSIGTLSIHKVGYALVLLSCLLESHRPIFSSCFPKIIPHDSKLTRRAPSSSSTMATDAMRTYEATQDNSMLQPTTNAAYSSNGSDAPLEKDFSNGNF